MARLNVLIERSRAQVWDVLADGCAYADWVVGTRAIRAVDDDWPALGSAIHYTVGVGPLTYDGATTVRQLEPQQALGLEADGGVLGTARIHLELRDWGDDTVLLLDEHPLRGFGYRWHNALADAVLLVRGRPMVHKLARLVESRHPR